MANKNSIYKKQLKNHISYNRKSIEGTKSNILHLKKRIKNLQGILVLEQESMALDLIAIKKAELILSKLK